MTVKRYTIAEKIKMCETAIFAEKEGTSIYKTAKKLGVTNVSLYIWVEQYRTGKLTGKPENEKEGISKDFMGELKEGFNGKLEPGKIEIIICTKTGPGEIVLEIDDPGFDNVTEQKAAIKERVFEQLKLCVVSDF